MGGEVIRTSILRVKNSCDDRTSFWRNVTEPEKRNMWTEFVHQMLPRWHDVQKVKKWSILNEQLNLIPSDCFRVGMVVSNWPRATLIPPSRRRAFVLSQSRPTGQKNGGLRATWPRWQHTEPESWSELIPITTELRIETIGGWRNGCKWKGHPEVRGGKKITPSYDNLTLSSRHFSFFFLLGLFHYTVRNFYTKYEMTDFPPLYSAVGIFYPASEEGGTTGIDLIIIYISLDKKTFAYCVRFVD